MYIIEQSASVQLSRVGPKPYRVASTVYGEIKHTKAPSESEARDFFKHECFASIVSSFLEIKGGGRPPYSRKYFVPGGRPPLTAENISPLAAARTAPPCIRPWLADSFGAPISGTSSP